MQNESSAIIQILEDLNKSIEVRGLKATSMLLRLYDPKDLDTSLGEYEKFVISEVAKAFNVEFEDLFFGRYKRASYKYAIGLCVYYLYNVRTLGDIQKKIFKYKNKSLLSKYRREIMNFTPIDEEDKKFMKIKKDLDKKIKTYKIEI